MRDFLFNIFNDIKIKQILSILDKTWLNKLNIFFNNRCY